MKQILFEYPSPECDDLIIFKDGDLCGIEVEGNILFHNIDEALDHYCELLRGLHNWLKKYGATKMVRIGNTVYKTVDIEIYSELKNSTSYTIFASAPMFGSLWETYMWLRDVIEQLKTIKL